MVASAVVTLDSQTLFTVHQRQKKFTNNVSAIMHFYLT
jgi:hypothetical protein